METNVRNVVHPVTLRNTDYSQGLATSSGQLRYDRRRRARQIFLRRIVAETLRQCVDQFSAIPPVRPTACTFLLFKTFKTNFRK